MKKSTKKVIYSEPADYFPKEIRKEFKLGEFAEEVDVPDSKDGNCESRKSEEEIIYGPFDSVSELMKELNS